MFKIRNPTLVETPDNNKDGVPYCKTSDTHPSNLPRDKSPSKTSNKDNLKTLTLSRHQKDFPVNGFDQPVKRS